MTVNPFFERWVQSYAGCDGGDMGTPARRAIWLCGIEWGGSRTAAELDAEMRKDASQPPAGYEDASHNTAYVFNRQALKLLAAIAGMKVHEYREFCALARPFTEGSTGYFKLNLYPVAFKNTDQSRWHEAFSEVTGLRTKAEYIN